VQALQQQSVLRYVVYVLVHMMVDFHILTVHWLIYGLDIPIIDHIMSCNRYFHCYCSYHEGCCKIMQTKMLHQLQLDRRDLYLEFQ
jgi:hypothetical protein